MTIIMTSAIPDGVVMGSESRRILLNKADPQSSDYNSFEVHNDNTPKTFLLAGYLGLNYSGVSAIYDKNNKIIWDSRSIIKDFEEKAAKADGSLIYELGEYLNEQFKFLLDVSDEKFGFQLACIHPQYNLPVVLSYDAEGKLFKKFGIEKIPGDEKNIGFRSGSTYAGMVDIIGKLTKNESTDYEMPLEHLVDYVELTINVGAKYLQYFKGHRAASGGPVNILVITPEKCGFLHPTWIRSRGELWYLFLQEEPMPARYIATL